MSRVAASFRATLQAVFADSAARTVMIGAGFAYWQGKRLPGAEALAQAGLAPVVLGPKEGLALINGTQFSTACALAGLWGAWGNLGAAIVTGVVS